MPFDVLDGEKWLPLHREARVIQACDIRMRQRGEDVPFARHSLRKPRALPGAVRKLQRDRPIDEPVETLRQPHGAHAAAAQLAHQAIGPNGVARLLAVGGGVDDIPRASITVELRECVEEVAVPGVPGAREQITQARFESCVLRRQPFYPLLTMRRRLIESGIQQLIQLSPGTGVDLELLHEESPTFGAVGRDGCHTAVVRRGAPLSRDDWPEVLTRATVTLSADYDRARRVVKHGRVCAASVRERALPERE